MRPAKKKIKKFRMDTKYVHHRSEGLTRRQNKGTRLLVIDDRKKQKSDAPRDIDPPEPDQRT
jgi:hypothetical protein